MAPAQWIDAHTPSVSVVDSRGLAVRSVAYCRHPLTPSSVETRITRNHFDAAGRQVASWDPRLWGTAPKPNLATTRDLQSQPLLVDSVDAGWQLSLLDQAGMARSFWDGCGSQRHTEYDELQRPTTVTEQMKDESPRVSERFAYAGAGDEFAVHNQCGQSIRHDHPAGRRSLCEYGVGGSLLAEETRFLLDLAPADWSSESADARLEKDVFRTAQQYGPSGEMLCQTDAKVNLRAFAYNQAGELQETRLRLADASGPPQVLVGDIRYDAVGRIERERAANGVVTTARYAPEDGRLIGLLSCDARGTPLQHLEYAYYPVGNISSVEDKVALTRYFNQQRIDPINRHRYDSLHQLVEATGREVSQPAYGPALPAWQTTPLDPNHLRNYTQTFNYDAAGNLQARHHSGVKTFEMFTSTDSNRSVAEEGNLADGFDSNGNQRELLRGQEMRWDIRNQLSRVTMVRREDGSDDTECYFYDSPGHRLRKVRLTETSRRTLRAEVRYLPGLEIHRDTATGEERHVLSVEAGLSHVRALHWVEKLPSGVRNDQLRFCLNDHLNSCTLELDEQGALLSQEVYYPFGGTALWAGASDIEVKYKTIRYSGKERDATGLYCYGFRYYAPWLQRWVSADPIGSVDGLNLFLMVNNRPVSLKDEQGLTGGDVNLKLPEKIGKWQLEKLQFSYSDLNSDEAVGNNVVANIELSYKPDWKDSVLGVFQEMPNLKWKERITLNDFSKNQSWSFKADMLQHNPSSRTMEVWPRRYIEAFNSAAGQPTLVRGAVVLRDLRGNNVSLAGLGAEVSGNEEKSKAVRNYLSKNGGTLAIEVHDVPSIITRENTHKERLLEIQVGLSGAKTTAAINQYLNVEITPEKSVSKRFVSVRPIPLVGRGLKSVEPPSVVSKRRSYTRFPGEVLSIALR
jgi:insecticidal toxin complex protein TccC